MADIDDCHNTGRMTIDLDQAPTATTSRPRPWWLIAACIACVLLGADLATRLTPNHTAPTPAPPALHTVTVVVHGGQPYIALTGAVEQAGGINAGTMTVPAGTTVHVFVAATVKTVGVFCSIAVDGGTPTTARNYGIGTIAQCDLTVTDPKP